MSIIIRLQNLPWSANSVDIRRYFQGLAIPEGGVHIVGGEKGDAFIAFSTDEDARQAMERDGGKIKEVRVKLLLSSHTEMQRVIEQARSQNITAATSATTATPVTTTVPQKVSGKEAERRRPSERSRSPERRRDRDKSPADRDRGSRRSRRERSRSRSPRRSRDRDRHSDRSKRDEKRKSEDISKSARDEDVRSLPSVEPFGMTHERGDIDKRQGLPNGDVNNLLPNMRAISAYPTNEISSMTMTATSMTSYPASMGSMSNRSRVDRIQPTQREFEIPKRTESHWNMPLPPSDNKRELWDDNRRGLLAAPNTYEQTEKYPSEKRNYSKEPPAQRSMYMETPESVETKYPPYNTQSVYDSHSSETGRQENTESLLPRPNIPQHREDYKYRDQRGKMDELQNSYNDSRTQPTRELQTSSHVDSGYDSGYPTTRQSSFCIEIRNMPYNVNYKDVRDYFRGIHIPSDGLKLINNDQGFRTGVGYVRFLSENDVLEALKRSGQYMGNAYVEVFKCQEEAFENAVDSFIPGSTFPRKTQNTGPLISRLQPKEEDLCILLKGLPYLCKEEDIINFFDGLSILDVFIEYDRTGRAIGTGFVEFGSYEDYQSAMSMNRQTIGHRYIELSVASKDMMNEARKNVVYGRNHSLPSNDPHAIPKDLSSVPPSADSQLPACVLLQSLPYDVTDRDIADFFSEVGVVPRAIHIMLGPNGMPYGDAFAEFNAGQEYDRAMKKNGQFMGPVMVTVKPIPYGEMIDILGGPAPKGEPLLDRPSDSRERSLDDQRMDSIANRRTGPSLPDRRAGHPDRRIGHIISDRRIDHSSSDRILDHHIPPDRRLDHSSDRRMDHIPPQDRRLGSLHSDRGIGLSDRRMGAPLSSLPPLDKMIGSSLQQERRMGLSDKRIGSEKHDLSDNINDKLEISETKTLEKVILSNERKDDINLDTDNPPIMQNLDKEDAPLEKRRHLMDPPLGWTPNERERILLPNRPLLDPDERNFMPGPGPDIRPMLRGPMSGPRPRMPMDGPDHRGPMPRPPRGPHMPPRGPHLLSERMRPPFPPIGLGPEGFGKPGCVVAVTNMAYQAGVEDILGFFKEFVLRKEDIIRRFNERGQPTGEARICFQAPQDAQKAVQELNRKTLAGRPINLYLM